jgi:septal ring factor EnvC (AmiA/AmiB activator)
VTEGRPHLVAVPPEPSERPVARRSGGAGLRWLLVAVAVICAVGWGLARHESSELARELAAVQGALAEASASLAAIEAQRAEVRSQLQALSAEASALSARLAEVEALLAADPAPAADAQPRRNEAEPQN